jgi:hypothetical protein
MEAVPSAETWVIFYRIPGVTFQKTVIFTVTAVRTSNAIQIPFSYFEVKGKIVHVLN